MFSTAEGDQVSASGDKGPQIESGRHFGSGIHQNRQSMAMSDGGEIFQWQHTLGCSGPVIKCRGSRSDVRFHLVGKGVVVEADFHKPGSRGPDRMIVIITMRAMRDEFVGNAGGVGKAVHAIYVEPRQASGRT